MNSKTYKIGFFVLIVINLVLVVILALGPKSPMQQKNLKEQIGRDLNFTLEQKAEFDEMVEKHRNQMSTIRSNEREAIKMYFDLLKEQPTDAQRVELLRNISTLQEQQIVVTYDHFQELKALCSEEQLPKFDQLIGKMLPSLLGENRQPLVPPRK